MENKRSVFQLYETGRMCWSEEVSLFTAATASSMATILLLRNKGIDRGIGLFSLVVAAMQFAEYWMWRGDSRGTTLGILSLLLQPLVLGVFVLLWNGYPRMAVLFGFLWIACCIRATKAFQNTPPSTVGPNGHLVWNFLPAILTPEFQALYWPILLGAWFFLPSEGLVYGISAILSVGISKFLFPQEWGTLWCWWANLIPLVRL